MRLPGRDCSIVNALTLVWCAHGAYAGTMTDAVPVAKAQLGARFLRADLHVHTHSDSDVDPKPDLAAYIAAAVAQDIEVLAITDHNKADFAREALRVAVGQPVVVLPGVEISTHDGHLLALFDPNSIEQLDALVHPENLQLKQLPEGDLRSRRSMLDLVEEIARRGGLAIPAHVDTANGMCSRLREAELTELLTSPALAGLEFGKTDALETWFTDDDGDDARRAAWKARANVPDLKERGLARLMSSDAHSPGKVGLDRRSRTLTRLRLDDANFAAIRNAVLLNPKARCKAEAILPIVYPRILSATFEGGFLDGVTMNFSPNLNCLIGGRGSGKSTALLAIRTALGAPPSPEEDPDDAERMPTRTTVRFIDNAGSERLAIRNRGADPVDSAGYPIRLRMADLGQDESGRLAREYNNDPSVLLAFLDEFLVRHPYDEAEQELDAQLAANASEILRTSGVEVEIRKLETEQKRLEATLKAAEVGQIEEIARWAGLLASQGPMIGELDNRVGASLRAASSDSVVDLDKLAAEFGVDLNAKPASDHIAGEKGLRKSLEDFDAARTTINTQSAGRVREAAQAVLDAIGSWRVEQNDLERRLQKRQAELEAQGLKVEAGAIREIAKRLNDVKTKLIDSRKRREEHDSAGRDRLPLIEKLHANRDSLYEARRATMRRVADAANRYSDGLTLRVYYDRAGVDGKWIAWLSSTFGLRQPRVSRLAQQIKPRAFAKALLSDRAALTKILDPQDGTPFLSEDAIKSVFAWPSIFELETMECPDRPRIEVQQGGNHERRQFDHLSAGQQRSVLLSLLLCAERSEPLVLDQPEDHLDGQYIATAVVRHLEAAKERRQVLIATHSANLTVLGDAELVVPMQVSGGLGRPFSAGAVDRPETRDQVCQLLEGGVQAYKKRGQRYGMRFAE